MDRRTHWEEVYRTKQPTDVSWYQADPARSLALIAAAGLDPTDPIIDVGGGASLLVDRLLALGYRDLTVLEIAAPALDLVRRRLGPSAEHVTLIQADVTAFVPTRQYALWHDRAVFHFLTEAADRQAYFRALKAALRPAGHAIIATFALDGPPRCSGLDVVRYDVARLAAELGPSFNLVQLEHEQHVTPTERVQSFQYCWFTAAA